MEVVVRFRTTPEEKVKLEEEAKKLGLTVSSFLRLLIHNWSDGVRFERKSS